MFQFKETRVTDYGSCDCCGDVTSVAKGVLVAAAKKGCE